MTNQSQWVFFIEQNPQFNKLTSSKIYMSILRLLETNSLSADKVHLEFPQVKNSDLDLILESLEKLKLIYKMDVSGQLLYSVSPLGKKLLKIYASARKGFSIE